LFTAQRDNWTPAIHILKQFGAKNSEVLYREQHGALIEEARELESERQKLQLPNEIEQELQSTSPQQQRPRRSTWLDVAGAALAGLDQEKLQPKEDVGTLASNAHSEMKDGLHALQHRGNKVNELSDKTDALENNANEFKRLAMEARKRLEKKNKGMNFLNPFAR
jgi:nucleotidyltransferase/DNA polymerase involved in DNA repair